MSARIRDGNASDLRRWSLCLALALLLTGCAAIPGRPIATTDTVLAAQYRTNGTHGALTGEEAGRITDSYQQQIGTASAPPKADAADTSDMGSGSSTAVGPSALGR